MDKMQLKQGHFTNDRDQKLFYHVQFPPSDKPLRGTVLFLHGMGEHALRFQHVYDHLNEHGFGVLAYDMISHGQSECECANVRGHGEKFKHFVHDTNAFLQFAKAHVLPAFVPLGANIPLIFMGISFGTLVGVHTVLSGKHEFAAMILASPAVSVEWTPLLRVQALVSKPLSWAIPTVKLVPGVNFDALTRDPAFLQDYMSDPLNIKENLTARMGEQVLGAMTRLQQDARVEDCASPFCKIPVLIMQGTEDKVTSYDMAKQFFERLATSDKEFKEWHGLFHCVFNEPEKQAVLSHTTEWLTQRFPSLPTTPVSRL